MAVSFEFKEKYTISDLLEIMRLLRTPEGCPWDREQTHESIRSNLLEETHEALEAIDRGDMPLLQEELGDVLLQVVFHAQMEQEKGSFTFDDVVDGICKKLVVRHPHVFGGVTADDAGQVLKNWDAIKRETKGGKTQADMLRAVPRALPALMRAGKVQNRARRNSSRRSLPATPPRWRRSSGTCCFRRSTSPALSTPTRSRRSPARRTSLSAASPWSNSSPPNAGWI